MEGNVVYREMTREEKLAGIERSFTYHTPKGDQQERYVKLRDTAKALAILIKDSVRDSREQAVAITKLEEAIMWANKGIACNE